MQPGVQTAGVAAFGGWGCGCGEQRPSRGRATRRGPSLRNLELPVAARTRGVTIPLPATDLRTPKGKAPAECSLRARAPPRVLPGVPGIGFPSFAPSRGGHSSGALPPSSRGLWPSWNGLATVKPDRELGTLCGVAGRKTAATLIIPTPVSRCGPHLIN